MSHPGNDGTVEGGTDIGGDVLLILLACFSSDTRCFRYLLSKSDICLTKRIDNTEGYQPLHIVAFMNDGPEFRGHLELLLDDPRINPNVFSDIGLSPLHCLCLSDQIDQAEKIERVKLLLRKGADPAMKRGENPTVFAALANKIDSIESEEEQEPHWEVMNVLENYLSDLETDRQLREESLRLSAELARSRRAD